MVVGGEERESGQDNRLERPPTEQPQTDGGKTQGATRSDCSDPRDTTFPNSMRQTDTDFHPKGSLFLQASNNTECWTFNVISNER
jgi:hypothetical protein